MTLPNAHERELAAKFFFEALPKSLVAWIATGVETQEARVDEDVQDLAGMLARYRIKLEREGSRNNRQAERYR